MILLVQIGVDEFKLAVNRMNCRRTGLRILRVIENSQVKDLIEIWPSFLYYFESCLRP